MSHPRASVKDEVAILSAYPDQLVAELLPRLHRKYMEQTHKSRRNLAGTARYGYWPKAYKRRQPIKTADSVRSGQLHWK
jgi:hypothetical protein